MKPPLEKDILKACLLTLQARGVFCWRNNTAAFAGEYKGKRRYVRCGIAGASDILGILPDGRFLAVECKRPGEKPTPQQVAFMAIINERGGVAFVATSAKQLDEILAEL